MNALRKLFWLSALYNFHITAVYLAGTDNALADSISRMHETTGLHNFYAFLCSKFSTVSANAYVCFLSGPRDPTLAAQLTEEVLGL